MLTVQLPKPKYEEPDSAAIKLEIKKMKEDTSNMAEAETLLFQSHIDENEKKNNSNYNRTLAPLKTDLPNKPQIEEENTATTVKKEKEVVLNLN